MNPLEVDEYFKKCSFIDEKNYPLSDTDKNVEFSTRYLASKYINKDAKVLELGARYGTASVYIDKLLTNSKTQLVCVDPDKYIEKCLEYCKKVNNANFNYFIGAISKKELFLTYNGCGWENKTYELPPNNIRNEKINTITFEDIQNKFNINFDVLVADCEGALLDFLIENVEHIDNFKTIIYEEDGGINHPINGTTIDYNKITDLLISKNYKLVETYVDQYKLNNKCWIKL